MFHFKQFSIDDSLCAMKVGTDAVLLGSWVDTSNANCIVDAGCGSGVISLMMAQRESKAQIIAIDIDTDACLCCNKNVDLSLWKDRVQIIHNDIMAGIPPVSHPLLIVSNPPFFNEPLKSPDQKRALARHGETFGIEALINLASASLNTKYDSLAFISPAGRNDEVEWLLACARLAPIRITNVFPKRGKNAIRTLWQVKSEYYLDSPCHTDNLYIREGNDDYSKDYRTLTSPFYLY